MQTQALIIGGVMYVTMHGTTYVIEAKTGRQICKLKTGYTKETKTCYGSSNRGLVYYNKLYRANLDN